MLLKTPPAFAICSSTNVLNVFAIPAHHPPSITSPSRRRPASQQRQGTPSRCYATVKDAQNDPLNKKKNGTCPSWPTCANPTPYDIFAIEKSAPYTKARFAELVKQYHPDKHHATALDALESKTRLERYRLVVLANDILSSPDKRSAYDSWGAGWHLPETGAEDTRDINELYRKADRAWRHAPNSPGMNATWEDWEKWNERKNGEKQKPVYMSNASFAALVLAAIAVGTVAQTTRMESNSTILAEKRQTHEVNISSALRRQSTAVAGKGREERIERFLRERENLNYEFAPAKFDARQGSDTK
ncbi:DnaJ domain-containing protein [Colletotrichum truncatum]|uniref:DnaJ domain-containing protein n=1 Tax=Colletotrichum truncatum TaxID=5467 RepID=A0ACC3YY56_COLTU|nr:DnaJ domain-containing protein [Colletotrichum truncatum]KAF6790786.1 DnaJ domain-containing protein [Colletotrichum truncatum]